MSSFNYNPITGLRDSTVYPSEPGSEAEAREQFQGLFDQIKDFINDEIMKYPACKIYHNANQSIPSAVDTGLQFNSDAFVSDNMHSTNTDISKIKINTDGVYQLTATVGFDANSSGFRIVQFRVNGSTMVPGQVVNAVSTSGIGTNVTTTTLHKLNTGDVIEVFVNQNSGTAINVNSSSTYFMAVKVG